jgi:Gamma-glutamyl cyclotransferase, AIG2-like
MRFFFYGTLMDCDLLSLVLGRPVEQHPLKPALLRGYRRSALQGLRYPAILREPTAWVTGVILDRVREVDCDRLRRYEGADYVLKRGRAESPVGSPQSVLYFEPRPGAFIVTGKPWSLALWRICVKPSELRRLKSRTTSASR